MGAVIKEFTLQNLGCANCAAKMEMQIQKLDGVSSASVNFPAKTLTLGIEDPGISVVIVSKIKAIIKDIEPEVVVKEKYKSSSLENALILSGLDCVNCAGKIENEVRKLPGIAAASLNFANKKLVFTLESATDAELMIQKIRSIVKDIEPEVEVLDKANKTVASSDDDDNVDIGGKAFRNKSIRLAASGIFYFAALLVTFLHAPFVINVLLFVISYLLSGGTVLLKAGKNILKGRVFDENFLMSVATLGAFAIGKFEEGVAVMLFFELGMHLQNLAAGRSRKSIAALMDIRPDSANLRVDGEIRVVSPKSVKIGEVIIVKPGEKIPLDGIVTEGSSMVDTSALTGESVPREVIEGNEVLGGFINQNGMIAVRVSHEYGESTVAKILDLVQNASNKKAPTENFISVFARYYTPVVTIAALLIAVIPPLFFGAPFSDWLYRALVFLVISCPCALVLSIPLGFFGGIGAASRIGVLVKGSNYLEALKDIEIMVFDKTGTLTQGVFEVTQIQPSGNFTEEQLLYFAALAETQSNHPIAVSIRNAYEKDIDATDIKRYEEIPGHGTMVVIGEQEVLIGNSRLMERENIPYIKTDSVGTVVYIAVDKQYAGFIIISDKVKPDSAKTIGMLKKMGVKKTVMLTGDNRAVGEIIGQQLGLDEVHAELLPDQKVAVLESLVKEKTSKGKLAFVGDGINDAPVLARADIGIAMGALGSDAAIEAADVVLMTDEIKKLIGAVKISHRTKQIVWQNIYFALGVKVIVLLLGALGIATMWAAVFADVGVALIAVLNAMRVLLIKKDIR
jgi:Cd2+/Zn2+-exporting ATPase